MLNYFSWTTTYIEMVQKIYEIHCRAQGILLVCVVQKYLKPPGRVRKYGAVGELACKKVFRETEKIDLERLTKSS